MGSFCYKAKDKEGKIKKGVIECATETDFYNKLDGMNLYCISVKIKGQAEASEYLIKSKLKIKEIAIFCRELSVMISAGMNLMSALQLLYNRADKERLKHIYMKIVEGVEKGDSLYDTMRKQRGVYPNLLLSMVLAGESSGNLDVVMGKMAEYYEKEADLQSKMQNAMIYPLILIFVTLAVVISLFAFVLPQFFTLFEGQEVPGITAFFMSISQFLTQYWYLLIGGIVVMGVLIRMMLSSEHFKMEWDRIKLKIPVLGGLIEKLIISHFANAMNILYASGITIVQSLTISTGTVSNRYVSSSLVKVNEMIEKGFALSESLQKEKLFDNMMWSMIEVGEESGNLEIMFLKLSEYYSKESERATQKMMAILEPMVLVVIACIVALVIASVLLPIYSMYQIS